MSTWTKQKLGDVVEFIDGDRGKKYPTQGEFYKSGACLFLSTKNVPNTKFDFSSNMFITADKDMQLRKGKLLRGDYVLTTRGTVGNFAHYDESVPYDNMRLNSGMVILRKKSEKLINEYLQYFLMSPQFSHQVKSRVSGSAQPQLPIRDMTSMEVLLPPPDRQQAIASILSAYDDLIENNEKRIKTLEEMAQLLYNEWFVKFKFPGHEKVKMVNSGTKFGQIPTGWDIVKIGDLLITVPRKHKIQAGDYLRDGKYPIVDQGRDFIAGYTNIQDAIYDKDLIVFGDHSRCIKYINVPFACGADGTQLLLTNNSERMPEVLLYYVVLNAGLQNFNYARHFKFLKSIQVVKPDPLIATKFSSIVSESYVQIKFLRKQCKNLTQTRDLLIPRFVTER